MSELRHNGSGSGSILRQRGSSEGLSEEREIVPAACSGMDEKVEVVARYPPLTMVIRKTSIGACMLVVLGGLMWGIMQSVHSIQRWQQPSGQNMDPMCWPVVKQYLLLIAYLTLFGTFTLFAFMIPSLVITWIVTVVLTYLSTIGIGQERHKRRELVRLASGWAKDMSLSTFKSAMQEGKVFGIAAVLTLLMLPWVLGKSNIFAGQDCR